MSERPKRPMTRRQAEVLAKSNPHVRARLEAGEFDSNPPGKARSSSAAGSGRSGSSSRKPAQRRTVSAGTPPGSSRTPRQPPRQSQGRGARVAPAARTRDNGQPAPDPPKRGRVRSFIDGLFDI